MHDGMTFVARAPAATAASGPRHPSRPAAAAGAAARPRSNSSRCGPATCGSRPMRPRRTSTSSMAAGAERRRRRGARGAHRRLDRRPCSWPRCRCKVATTPARSSPASPATTTTSWTTSPRRSWPANPTTSGTSCSGRRSSSASPARSATPSPDADGGKATLVALERANLFLVPLDDRRQWYRYHHLFADVLRAHLLDERPDEVAELHRRASAWFEVHDDASQAISHALAGGDTGRAADLMELAMPRDAPRTAGGRARALDAGAARRRAAGPTGARRRLRRRAGPGRGIRHVGERLDRVEALGPLGRRQLAASSHRPT